MATYYITGVDKEKVGNHTYINRCLLHLVENNSVHIGEILTKDQVILLLSNNIIYTATWAYPKWRKGERVRFEIRDGIRYLRSSPDNQTTDNLLSLLPLANLGL